MGPNDVEIAFDGETRTVKLPAEPGTGGATFEFKGKGDARKLSLKTSGNGAVFANLSIATRPALMPLEPENNGFAIKRTYEKVEIDGSIKPAENLKVGDLILVTLDVNIPNERETYLAIDDALPAIFEAVNPDFKTSETQRVNAQRQTRSLYATHSEIRKDRVLFFADYVFGAGTTACSISPVSCSRRSHRPAREDRGDVRAAALRSQWHGTDHRGTASARQGRGRRAVARWCGKAIADGFFR